MFRIRQMIAGLLAWVGKVTLLFTLAGVGTGVVAYVLTRINTGAWPDAVVLGEPLGETLQSIGVEPPPSPWAFLAPFWRFVLQRPTWMIALLVGMMIGLILMTWGDAMERSIRHKLRHHELMRDRTQW
jgi:hypothetical protein